MCVYEKEMINDSYLLHINGNWYRNKIIYIGLQQFFNIELSIGNREMYIHKNLYVPSDTLSIEATLSRVPKLISSFVAVVTLLYTWRYLYDV